MSTIISYILEMSTSDILAALLLVITIISVICAFKAYHHQKRRALKDKAVELSKYYAENIIPLISFINYVMDTAGLIEQIKQLIPIDEIYDFDHKEISRILTREEYYDLTKKLNGDPVRILECKIHNEPDEEKKAAMIKALLVLKKSGNENHEKDEYNNYWRESLQTEYREVRTELLNNLEYFSMNFRYKLADEELVYQSIHQTFLSNVWILYLFIAIHNKNNENKYYTNIIELFIKWKERESRFRENQDRINVIATLNPHCGKPLK